MTLAPKNNKEHPDPLDTMKANCFAIVTLALTSFGSPTMFSDNGTTEYLPRREMVGPKVALLTSPVLLSQSQKFVWTCNIGDMPVSNGYSKAYYFNIRFLRRINNEFVPFEIPDRYSPGIAIAYIIRDSSGNPIIRLRSTLDEWRSSQTYYLRGGPKHNDVYYWPNYVENSRIRKARESGNIFFYPVQKGNYSIEVNINAPRISGTQEDLGVQLILTS